MTESFNPAANKSREKSMSILLYVFYSKVKDFNPNMAQIAYISSITEPILVWESDV